ncbi:MAG: hypothetical protein PWP23_929 [Candidatus Sumerlaeota bacterium]|nr:hypothetical protein [Candidatus Sumerlaeota bacterium]
MTGQNHAAASRVLYVAASADEAELAALVFGRHWPAVSLIAVNETPALLDALAGGPFLAAVLDAGAHWAGGSALIPMLRRDNAALPLLILRDARDCSAAHSPEPACQSTEKCPAVFLRLPALVRSLVETPGSPAQSSAALEPLLDDAGIGWFLANRDGRLLEANAAFRRLIAADGKAAATSLNLAELSAAPGSLSRLLEQAAASETGIEERLPLRALDGSPLFVSLRLRRQDAAGALLRGLVEDHTARENRIHELETRIVSLESDQAELQHLTHFASHELQEPLRTVERFTRLLIEQCREFLNGTTDQHARLIVESTERAQRLVDDLLLYSRALNVPVRLERVDANRALAQALANVQALIEETGADVRRGPLPDTLRGDPRGLATLFQNLVANALKYRSTQKPRVEISAEPQGGEWRFAVRDNGEGIAENDRDRIFRPFERLHSHDEIPGTGLGLALCRRIAQSHGGSLWVESQPGEGSTFYFTLPAMEAPHESPR